ncbi:Lebercilin [Mactra antiquata]
MSKRREGSPYTHDSYADGYSDDFDDDDDADTSNRRYKTRSPLNRTTAKDYNDDDDDEDNDFFSEKTRPTGQPGANTYRKARGGMSIASGYFSPSSRKLDNQTTMDKLSLKSASEYQTPKPEKQRTEASEYYTPRSLATKTRSPTKKVFNRTNRGGRGRGRGRFSQLNSSRTSDTNVDNITKRVLSARRHKINEIQNLNQELIQQLKDLKDENKLLKKTQFRTDKALQKFEDRESELPALIQRQNNEVRSLKDQIRKWREKYEKTDRYLRDAEDDLDKVKAKMKKLKSLADEKDLPERSELNKKLNNAELEIEAKEVKIRELERYVQNLEKNHKHELGIERARQRDHSKQLTQLREENERLQSTVKEKDKEIQIKNIYVNRAQKPPHRLPNSYSGTPHGTPPPRRRRPSLSEADKMTPRDRAKQMEEKRREELRKQRELKQTPKIFAGNYQQHEKIKREKELRKMREDEEREAEERRRLDEKDRLEYERREREMNEKAEREAEDRRMREERERMKRESEERERHEREKQEREERERKQREKREREERERRERERQEQERRAAEERRRFEEDSSIQAERKKKDEILQKLKEIDEGGRKSDKPKDSAFSDPFFVTQGSKEDSQDSLASKKSYTFSKPVENLHKGKPSRKDQKDNSGMMFATGSKGGNQGQGRRRDIDGLETGGYNPTFSSKKPAASNTGTKTFSLFDDEPKPSTNNQANKPEQKSKLMEELFGSKNGRSSPQRDDIFSSPKQTKKTNQSRGGFPWEEDGPSKNTASTLKTKRENSSTLFGGGSAFVNDEDIHKSHVGFNSTGPRRTKQTTTAFHSRPTVNAVDDLDDDIEEVML